MTYKDQEFPSIESFEVGAFNAWFFMLMVAQRRETSKTNDWHEFRGANQDLVGKSRTLLLDRYYTDELLASDSVKRIYAAG